MSLARLIIEKRIEPVAQLKIDDLHFESFQSASSLGIKTKTQPNGIRLTHKPTGIVVIKDELPHAHLNRHAAIEELTQKLVMRTS